MLIPRVPTLPQEAPRLYLPGEAARLLGLADTRSLAIRAAKLRIRIMFTPLGHRRYYADDVDEAVAERSAK